MYINEYIAMEFMHIVTINASINSPDLIMKHVV